MKKIFTICTALACAFCAKAYDIVATVSIEGETKWYFDIELENNTIGFTAFQMDITLDAEGVELKSSDIVCDDIMSGHSMMLAKPEGRYRIVGYSTSNSTLKNETGRLFHFTLDGDITGITINNIIFAKPDGTEIEAKEFTKPLDRVNDPDAIQKVSGEEDVNRVIYNMEGKQVYTIDRRGIYIQNGKKIAK